MTENFVLAHGAWHGGWAWQPVASRLRAAGHRVWAPTSPGLGIDVDEDRVRRHRRDVAQRHVA